jgi:predicted unusual protein kinase regulating ubiquinone biosynthesis (AarF/ABC1/UbiB family)
LYFKICFFHRENKTQQPHTAANAQRFNELYASVAEEVFVPKVYSDLTTRKVLVMEWVDGSRLTDSAYLDKYGLDRSKLIDTLVQSSIRQILENGT